MIPCDLFACSVLLSLVVVVVEENCKMEKKTELYKSRCCFCFGMFIHNLND
jgi:hypothetical protein